MNALKCAVGISGLFLILIPVFGQEEDSVPPGWTGDIALSLSVMRGNAETTNTSVTFKAERTFSRPFKLSSSGFFLLNRTEGITSAESMGMNVRLDWTHSNRFFSYYEIPVVRDKFKNYVFRFLPGAGIGLKVIATETAEWALTTGLAQVYTKYDRPDVSDSFMGLAAGYKLKWTLSETAEFNQVLDLNTDISELSRYIVHLDTSLTAAVSKSLGLKLSLIDNYEHKPVGEGVVENDIAYLAGLSYKF